jgi:hypothetical protein
LTDEGGPNPTAQRTIATNRHVDSTSRLAISQNQSGATFAGKSLKFRRNRVEWSRLVSPWLGQDRDVMV